MVSSAVLTAVALAEVWALNPLLEAFAVLFAAPRFTAVAPLEMPFWAVGLLLWVDVLQNLLPLGQEIGLLIILLTQLWSESEGVSHKNLLLGLEPLLFMLGWVVAAAASTASSAVTVILKALAIKFQTAGIRAVARLMFFVCNWFSYFKNLSIINILIVVFLFNFI